VLLLRHRGGVVLLPRQRHRGRDVLLVLLLRRLHRHHGHDVLLLHRVRGCCSCATTIPAAAAC
jgi:hypothetical protein